jgi:hypothetical protein
MVSARRALSISVLLLGIVSLISSYTLTRSMVERSSFLDAATDAADPSAMRAAATAVAREVTGTLEVQRVQLATRVAAQSPGPVSQSFAAAASPAAAEPAASSSPARSPTPDLPDPLLPPTFRFFRGINLGGAPEIIGGRSWLGDAQARAEGLLTPDAAPVTDSDDPLSPPTDPSTARMLQTTVYTVGSGQLRIILPVQNGTYAVYVYLVENYQSGYRSLDIAVEGNPGHKGWSAPRGGWERLGPYVVAVADGSLDIDIGATSGEPSTAGLVIFRDEAAVTPSPAAVLLSGRTATPR